MLQALLAGLIILCLPGFAWLVWFWTPEQDAFEHLAVAVGASLSLAALLALAFHLTGWHFSSVSISMVLLLSATVLAAGILRLSRARHTGFIRQEEELLSESRGSSLSTFQYLATAGVFAGLVFWRFFQVRDLALPAWVDSLHHVLIVRAILENGGLPETLQPYLPIPFYYHFAFHISAAAQAWLAQVQPDRAVLVLGQLLNACVALSVYRLGKALWGDWPRAIVAALLVGFATQMPAYYATWGRYTLLTGLVLLPLAMAAAVELDREGLSRSRLAHLSLLTAGVLLAHYFAALLLALFLGMLLAKMLIEDLRAGRRIRDSRWLLVAASALLALLCASPWLLRAWSFSHGAAEIGLVSPSSQAVDEHYFPEYGAYLWRLAGPLRNQLLLALLPVGLVLGVWRRETRLFALWSASLILLSLPWGIYLAPFRPDHAVIVLFLPAGVLLADLAITAGTWLLHQGSSLAFAAAYLLAAGVVALLVWGMWSTRSIVNASTILATRADLDAIHWIEKNTPSQARFFHNMTHWLSGTYRGVDGGWWITPLTGRTTLLPVALYASGDKDYVTRMNRLAESTSASTGCSPEFWELVREQQITHIYTTQGKGPVQAADLDGCTGIDRVYQQGGVSIYQVEP